MSTNVVSKLQDQGAIAMATGSQTEKAVIKATRHNLKAPKEKHVRRLLMVCSDKTHKISNLIFLLAKRLEVPDWIVVLKTLVVFHRLLRDSNNRLLLQSLKYKTEIFSRLRKFADMTSQEAHHQSVFIRKYSQYLEEKVLVFKTLSVEFEKDPSVTKSYTLNELLERLPRLQSQLNALINCRATKDHINNAIIITSWNFLLKDSFKLFSALNFGIITLLEHYFTLPRETAQKAFDIYKLFTRETDGMSAIINISQQFTRGEIPELQHAPLSLLESLETYLNDLEAGRTPNQENIQHKQDLGKKNQQLEKSLFDMNELDFKSPDEMAKEIPFDPFGINQPVSKGGEKSQETALPPSFDPFADDKSESNLPTFFGSSSFSSSPFDEPSSKPQPSAPKPSTSQSSAPTQFDPFGDFPSQQQSQSSNWNSVSPSVGTYEDKKAQIEVLMKHNPSPSSNNGPSDQTSFDPGFDAFNINNQPQNSQPSWDTISKANPSFNPLTDVSATSPNNPFFSTESENKTFNPFI